MIIDPRGGSALALSAVGMRSRLAVLVARQEAESSTVVVNAAPPDAVSLGTIELHAGYGNNADIAALRDVAGVCWGSGGGDRGADVPSAIDFRLVGPDGLARGTAVRVVEGPFRSGRATCSVGTDDAGFVVAWWDGSSLWVRRVDVAPH